MGTIIQQTEAGQSPWAWARVVA